jgi:DNA transformation protein
MNASKELIEHYEDVLAPLGEVESQPMFSGAGFSKNGFTFAMLIQDELFMRVDDETRPQFEAAGSEPFSYDADGKRVVMRRYFSVPEDAADNAEMICELGRTSLASAKRDDIRKSPRSRR